MANPLFTKVAVNQQKRSMFNLSHERKMSLNMGDLVPCLLMDVIPGDKITLNSEMLMRLAPMSFPMMHRVNVYMHFFYVPNRLVFTPWEDFITGGRLGTDNTSMPVIQLTNATKGNFLKGMLPDYMGIPVVRAADNVVSDLTFSALPFRAYQMIYNEYYRDQNLTEELVFGLGSVANEWSLLTTLRKRCWEKDYFTSALPWAQRGTAATIVPSIEYADPAIAKIGGTNVPDAGDLKVDALGKVRDLNDHDLQIQNIDGIEIDVNDLRTAERVQRWLEKNARFGSRYIEQILAHFGIKVPDYRVQRPEFLGGFKNPIVVSEVLASINDANNDLGDMAGHGISVANANGFTKEFQEHGYVIGIMSVLPRTAYMQGLDKHWTRNDKFDFPWPEFANLGEQVVENQEVYYDFSGVKSLTGTFGYQSRYAEMKFKNSSVHGDFRDNMSDWHMARKFDSAPSLNEDFVESDPTHRVFAVETETVHKLYCQIYQDIKALRPLPQWGIPSL